MQLWAERFPLWQPPAAHAGALALGDPTAPLLGTLGEGVTPPLAVCRDQAHAPGTLLLALLQLVARGDPNHAPAGRRRGIWASSRQGPWAEGRQVWTEGLTVAPAARALPRAGSSLAQKSALSLPGSRIRCAIYGMQEGSWEAQIPRGPLCPALQCPALQCPALALSPAGRGREAAPQQPPAAGPRSRGRGETG